MVDCAKFIARASSHCLQEPLTQGARQGKATDWAASPRRPLIGELLGPKFNLSNQSHTAILICIFTDQLERLHFNSSLCLCNNQTVRTGSPHLHRRTSRGPGMGTSLCESASLAPWALSLSAGGVFSRWG